jgi:hypothetical protein
MGIRVGFTLEALSMMIRNRRSLHGTRVALIAVAASLLLSSCLTLGREQMYLEWWNAQSHYTEPVLYTEPVWDALLRIADGDEIDVYLTIENSPTASDMREDWMIGIASMDGVYVVDDRTMADLELRISIMDDQDRYYISNTEYSERRFIETTFTIIDRATSRIVHQSRMQQGQERFRGQIKVILWTVE